MTAAEFKKELKSITKNIRYWEREINKLSKREDDQYKFIELKNANHAIYSCYVNIDLLITNYHA